MGIYEDVQGFPKSIQFCQAKHNRQQLKIIYFPSLPYLLLPVYRVTQILNMILKKYFQDWET